MSVNVAREMVLGSCQPSRVPKMPDSAVPIARRRPTRKISCEGFSGALILGRDAMAENVVGDLPGCRLPARRPAGRDAAVVPPGSRRERFMERKQTGNTALLTSADDGRDPGAMAVGGCSPGAPGREKLAPPPAPRGRQPAAAR